MYTVSFCNSFRRVSFHCLIANQAQKAHNVERFCRSSHVKLQSCVVLCFAGHLFAFSTMPTALCIRCLDYQYCMRCGLCRGPWYCSGHCQKDDWPRHKKECHIYMATECLKKDSPLPWDCIEKVMGFIVKQPAY